MTGTVIDADQSVHRRPTPIPASPCRLHGLTMSMPAAKVGVTPDHRSRMANGLHDPSPGVLDGLHGVLFMRIGVELRVVPAGFEALA